MIINPKILELFKSAKNLTSAPEGDECHTFAEEYRALATTPLVDGLMKSFRRYENDPTTLSYLLATAVLLGVRVGRNLTENEKVLITSQDALEWDGKDVFWKQ